MMSPIRICLAAALVSAAALSSGCNVGGFLANAAAGVAGQATVEASYKNLANQKCAIMVWADEGVLDDYRSLQLDVARGVELKLLSAAKVDVKEVANITWLSPEQVLMFQQNHNDATTEAVEEIAPRLGITRLIYVEIEQFETHPSNSPDLWRGNMIANIEVVEVNGGLGKVVYNERNVKVVSPKDCPEEGLPNLDDQTVYAATVDTFTSEIGKRFVPHEADAGSNPSPSDYQSNAQP